MVHHITVHTDPEKHFNFRPKEEMSRMLIQRMKSHKLRTLSQGGQVRQRQVLTNQMTKFPALKLIVKVIQN